MKKRGSNSAVARSKALKLMMVNSVDEIPNFASEEDEVAFWDTHMLSDRLWAELQPIPDDHLPSVRDKLRDSNL